MKDLQISINAASIITGYKPAKLRRLSASGAFPLCESINGADMFSLAKVLEWDRLNRARLLDDASCCEILNMDMETFANHVIDESANFPEPAKVVRSEDYSYYKAYWLCGDILDWHSKHYEGY